MPIGTGRAPGAGGEPSIRLMFADGAATPVAARVREAPAASTFRLIFPENDTEEALLRAVPEADAILCYHAALTAPVIQAAPALRFIQKHGQNCRDIDVAAASARNVRVATVPLLRSITVAEHALALMLACARKVIAGHRAVTGAVYRERGLEPIVTSQQRYRSNWADIGGVAELYQATVGIVGMGDIGIETAKRCRAFGMKVVYHQRTPHHRSIEERLEMRYLALDELLRVADHVVLALPHTPETDSLIGGRELTLMKPTAILVNVGRGGLIDEEALADALGEGRIAMAGLDVYRSEPLPATSALLGLPNVVLLPHLGGGSYRSWEVDLPASLGNIRRFFESGRAEGIINP